MNTYNQRPLVGMALFAFVGTLIGSRLPTESYPYVWALIILGSGLLIWCWIRGKLSWHLVSVLFFLIFTVLAFQQNRLPRNSLAHLVPSAKVTLIGVVDTIQKHPFSSSWSGRVTVRQCNGVKVCGNIRLYSKTISLEPFIGRNCRFTGKLQTYHPPSNPGEFDYKYYLKQSELYGFISLYHKDQIELLEQQSWLNGKQWIYTMQRHLEQLLEACVTVERFPLVQALFLGKRNALSPLEREKIARSGLAHLLAISGLHIGLLVATWFVISQWAGFPKSITSLGASLLAIAACLITNSHLPAQRATAMVLITMAFGLFFIRTDKLSVLALIGLVMLGEQPLRSGSASFQLTFIATALVLLCLEFTNKPTQWWQSAGQALFISTVVTIGLLPLTSHHFYQLAWLPIVTNLIAGPLLLCILWTGVITMCVGSLYLPAGMVCGWLLDRSVALLQTVVDHSVLTVSASFYVIPMPVWQIGLFYSCLIAAYCVRKKRLWLVCLLVMAGSQLLVFIPRQVTQNKVTFLNCALGESTFIQTPDHTMLIDTGTENDFLWRVRPFLAQQGINSIDQVMISHKDTDHSGGLLACHLLFDVKQCLVGSDVWVNKQEELKQIMIDKNVQICILQRDDSVVYDQQKKLIVIWPPKGTRQATNGESLTSVLVIDGVRLFFTGDSPAQTEKQWDDLDPCHILKAGHHGDGKSSSHYLINRLQPKWVVIMPGSRNPYGLPDPITIERFQRKGVSVENTKQHGAIQFQWSRQKGIEKRYWQ